MSGKTHIVLALLTAGVTFSAVSAHGATEADEVRFRAKRFAPAKPLEAKPYQPARQAEVKRFEAKPFEARPFSGGAGRPPQPLTVRPFTPKQSEIPDLPVYVGKPQADKPFAASPNRITVPSVPPDPKTVEEKKPFVSGVKQREDKVYTAKEKKEGKNPLLTPRQGIKEEVHDDE